ncbi:class I SAM-dependent methyltransferase [Parapedobacter tibetensis]|uniref:class I SAM-dependent methyltransferase n=1 Tax=Parapedobacter tibetensis TaxID=2972951 RepID=UPI00214D76A4|nr:class I SAM-dependent methyltransferase [Parapedobacter tibetensis]
MEIQEAIALIEPGVLRGATAQHWTDLGCGNGTFTYALAHLLSPGSSITAVDSLPQRLNKIMGNRVSIQFQQSDINLESFHLPKLEGILMANSLHYIQEKESLIKRLERYFNKEKQFLIIEYEANISNPWVPFPITFSKLSTLFDSLGYYAITKINERPSSFGGSMYAALIRSK